MLQKMKRLLAFLMILIIASTTICMEKTVVYAAEVQEDEKITDDEASVYEENGAETFDAESFENGGGENADIFAGLDAGGGKASATASGHFRSAFPGRKRSFYPGSHPYSCRYRPKRQAGCPGCAGGLVRSIRTGYRSSHCQCCPAARQPGEKRRSLRIRPFCGKPREVQWAGLSGYAKPLFRPGDAAISADGLSGMCRV